MTKKYYELDDFDEPDYDSFDVQIDFRFTGDKSNYVKYNETYSNHAKIIIDRLQPDGICHEGGGMALYFKNVPLMTNEFKRDLEFTNDYWQSRSIQFEVSNYSDYKNNIYLNSSANAN